MDLTRIRQLLREGHSVVVVEDGQPPLVIRELEQPPRTPAVPSAEVAEEVPIASRWPKGLPTDRPSRSIHQNQDHVLERLNKEILALKEQLAQEEQGTEQ